MTDRDSKPRRARGEGRLYKQTGSAVWWGKYYLNGKPQRFSTGERDERKAAKVLKTRIAKAMVGCGIAEDVRRVRYEDLEASLFADYQANDRRTAADLPRAVAPLRRAFAGMKALDITTARMREYASARLVEKAARATINKELAALGRMLTLASRDGRLPARPAVPKLRVENARTGFLEPADFEALCSALPSHLRAPTRFGYLSGWRRGEVIHMTWRQVDLATGTIRLDASQSKNGEARILAFAQGSPLDGLLREQHAQRRLDCPHVFHRNGKPLRSFYAAWRKAAKAIGRPQLLFHDLRRSAVRNMVRAGVPERVCMARSGHKTRAVFDRYNIVSEADLRDADTRVAAYLSDREREADGHSSGIAERKVVALQEAASL